MAFYNDKQSWFIKKDIILTVCIPNDRTSKYMQQKLIERKGETGKSTIIIGDYNTALSIFDKKNQ